MLQRTVHDGWDVLRPAHYRAFCSKGGEVQAARAEDARIVGLLYSRIHRERGTTPLIEIGGVFLFMRLICLLYIYCCVQTSYNLYYL